MWPVIVMGVMSAASSIAQSQSAANSAETTNAINTDNFNKSMDYKAWSDKQNAQYLKEQGAYNAAALQANSANDWAMKAANLNMNWASKQVDTAALYGAPGQKFSVAKPELPAQQAMPNYNDFVSKNNEAYSYSGAAPNIPKKISPMRSVLPKPSSVTGISGLPDPGFSMF